ncbi:MAG: glycosyltransferase family 2 protein [Oscillospiraceae bacterium]|nr:glycosyltransferase family 2 protein [Oscillospiraceae bacterium]
MSSVFAMLPCYNESQNIDPLVRKWLNMKEDLSAKGYRLFVRCIDDKSKDNTKEVIEKLCAEFPDVVGLIAHEVNKGLGGALKTAFDSFIAEGKTGDVCFLMDGDNTHDPVFSLAMLDRIAAGADCAIASRYRPGSLTHGVKGIRLFMSWGAKQFYTFVLRVRNVRDYTCGYRAYTYDIISRGVRRYGTELVEKRSFACMMEVLYKLWMIGARFGEVPFELHYDIKKGESKMRVIRTMKESMSTAVHLRRKLGKIKETKSGEQE